MDCNTFNSVVSEHDGINGDDEEEEVDLLSDNICFNEIDMDELASVPN